MTSLPWSQKTPPLGVSNQAHIAIGRQYYKDLSFTYMYITIFIYIYLLYNIQTYNVEKTEVGLSKF